MTVDLELFCVHSLQQLKQFHNHYAIINSKIHHAAFITSIHYFFWIHSLQCYTYTMYTRKESIRPYYLSVSSHFHQIFTVCFNFVLLHHCTTFYTFVCACAMLEACNSVVIGCNLLYRF